MFKAWDMGQLKIPVGDFWACFRAARDFGNSFMRTLRTTGKINYPKPHVRVGSRAGGLLTQDGCLLSLSVLFLGFGGDASLSF